MSQGCSEVELFAAYTLYAKTQDGKHFWAWSKVIDVLEQAAPGEALAFMLRLIRAVPDEVLMFIGEGSMETFLVWCGDAVIDDLANEIRRDPRVRLALRGAWTSRMSPRVAAAVESLRE